LGQLLISIVERTSSRRPINARLVAISSVSNNFLEGSLMAQSDDD
jgi:hypothetical protein